MKFRFVLLAVAALFLSSCITRSSNPIANSSEVELSGNNFEVTAIGLRGQASCPYLFGLIPLGDTNIATSAMDDLVASANIEGQSRSLVNFSADEGFSFYFFLTVKSIALRADVVEFR